MQLTIQSVRGSREAHRPPQARVIATLGRKAGLRTRRSHALLAGAALIAGGVALLGARSSGAPASAAPTARIPGQPLVGASDSKAPRSVSVADIDVDLDKVARDGDVYVTKLADGRRVTLTLDPDLQELAEKLLNESRAPRGAIVVMHPDGRILALAGRRTAEPKGAREGTFDWRLATDVWAPSASIFKLVTASALVRAGVDPDASVCYHGGVRSVLEHNLKDDKRDSRCESLAYGVAHSQNAILGKLAYQKLDPKSLEAEARALGWFDSIPLVAAKAAGALDSRARSSRCSAAPSSPRRLPRAASSRSPGSWPRSTARPSWRRRPGAQFLRRRHARSAR